MTGSFDHKLDDKGRLFIPSELREELGAVFHVIISDEDCLTVYPNDSWERFLEKFKTMSRDEQIMLRPLLANASKCEVDKHGRFVLPAKLRDAAKLQRDVTIVGMGTVLQIWDTETFKPINEKETARENLSRVIGQLSF